MPKVEYNSQEPENGRKYTEEFNQFYSRFAHLYDRLVKLLPFWQRWIRSTIPWIQGPEVLEISFGTGYLLSLYAERFNVHGIDYNRRLASLAKDNLRKAGKKADLLIGDAASLPYNSGTFNTLVNTMAFTGYPNGYLALSEMVRVLKPDGRIVMVDINYPCDENHAGMVLTRAWKAGGDIIRDMPALFNEFSLEWTDQEIGGFGSVHLYVAAKSEEYQEQHHE